MTLRMSGYNLFFQCVLVACFTLFIFSCSEKNDPAPATDDDNLIEASLRGSWPAVQLKLIAQLSGNSIDPGLFSHDVDFYRVIYKTTYQNTEIHASGLILLPKTTTPVPMISYQHGTIVEQSEAPSVQAKESQQVISYAGLASMGFITVVPDMVGFGESQDIFHPYYIEEPTATAVIDMLRAAVSLAKEKKLDFNTRLFLAGYSQGGYATLATHKALEQNPNENFQLIASFPGAGGYDIKSMQKYLFGLDTYPDPSYLAYLGMSYQSYYGESEVLTSFFNEPYASKIPQLFDGIKSKDDINAQLTGEIQALVKSDILTNIETGPEYEFLRGKFEENSLLDWKPTLPVFLYHGEADITVPYENSQITYQHLSDNGATSENLQLISLPGSDHSTAIEPYIEDVINKLQTLK